MDGIKALRKIRLDKLKKLRLLEKNPFPSTSERTHTISDALANFEELSKKETRITCAGRIRSIREHGGSTFFHFEDATGSIQGYLKRDVVGSETYAFFQNIFDIGDIAEFSGTLFVTKRGEKTLLVSDFRMLAKALLPLPDKWHGLRDVEERFRKRYLDLLMNKEVKQKFVTRSLLVKNLRSFLYQEGFLEVETPILQQIPGGARAKPFKTRLNALDMDLYLRIAPELYLKKLLVGGFEKIFEIGRVFRNEGMDATHNPDFTMIELYAAWRDYVWMMEFTERMLRTISRETLSSLSCVYGEWNIDLAKPFARIRFDELVKKYTGIDIWRASNEELRAYLKAHPVAMDKEATRANIIDELYKEFCRPHLVDPTFVTHLPIELNPFAKASENDPRTADRFQLVVGGIELVNAFSELNDPIEQQERLTQEVKDYKKDAKRVDKSFIEALEYGMPPAAGMGMGIDRLAMLFTNSHSVREVILFPTMRPKKQRNRNRTPE